MATEGKQVYYSTEGFITSKLDKSLQMGSTCSRSTFPTIHNIFDTGFIRKPLDFIHTKNSIVVGGKTPISRLVPCRVGTKSTTSRSRSRSFRRGWQRDISREGLRQCH
nr:hypothetical protein [Cressdnaviricota sp.]